MPTTYDFIGTVTGTGQTLSLTSIPTTFTDLRLVIHHIGTESFLTNRLFFNNDTAGNYGWANHLATGSSRTNGCELTSTGVRISSEQVATSTTQPTIITVDIFDYQSSSKWKNLLYQTNGARAGTAHCSYGIGLWKNTTAINQITFGNIGTPPGPTFNYSAGTRVTLYGIKAGS